MAKTFLNTCIYIRTKINRTIQAPLTTFHFSILQKCLPFQIICGITLKKVQFNRSTNTKDIWSTKLKFPFWVSESVSDTLVREKLSIWKLILILYWIWTNKRMKRYIGLCTLLSYKIIITLANHVIFWIIWKAKKVLDHE